MASKGSRMSAATRRRVERSAGALSTGAIKRMEANLDWYRALSAEDRSWVGLVAQAGIAAFIAWCRDPSAQPHITADVFGTAPRELTRSISLGQTLDLSVPPIPWHSHRERFAVLACALGVATGSAGKIGRDLGLLAQTEIGEAHEPDTSAGGSSTMPHKQNPVRAAIAIAAATRAPGLVSTMLSTMLQEHERGLGGWQAEWDTFPELVSTAGHAADAIAGALEALVVDPDRLRANLNMTGGLILAESIAMRLAPEMGKREAHAAIKRAARRAGGDESFADILASDPAVSAILDRSAIERALSPGDYLGSAEAFVAAVLSRRSQRKK